MTPLQSDTENARLTPAQQKVLLALAQGRTVTAAAAAAGLHRTTVYRWLEDEQFSTAVAAARAEYSLTLRDRMKELSALALDAIETVLVSDKSPMGTLARTAFAVLNRPRFPEPAWCLPDYASGQEEQLRKDIVRAELDSLDLLDEETAKRYSEEEK